MKNLMKSLMKHVCMVSGPLFAAVALLLSVGLISSCGGDKDACHDYCSKNFQCLSHNPTSDDTHNCVTACHTSLDNNCGNDNKAAATDKIEECVDKGCAEFVTCMVFETAPACFGFTHQ